MRNVATLRAANWGVLALLVTVTCWQASCRHAPRDPAAEAARLHLDRGDIALALRKPDVAEQAYRSALAARPADVAALRGLALAQLDQDKFDEALRSFGLLLQRDQAAFEALRNGPFCSALLRGAKAELTNSGDSRRAVELAQRARSEDCDAPGRDDLLSQALVREAERAEQADRPDAAAELYQAAAGIDPSRVESFIEAAGLLLEQGRRDEALTLLSRALERHPRDRRLQVIMLEALGILMLKQDVSLSTASPEPGRSELGN